MAKKAAPTGDPWQNRIIGYRVVPVEELLFNEANWRGHPKSQYEMLSATLKKVGIVQNIILNARTSEEWPEGQRGVETMVDGHCRALQADRDGQKTLPATIVDLGPEDERLVLATLDPIGAMAFTDAEKLLDLTEGLDTGDETIDAMLSDLKAKAVAIAEVAGDDEFESVFDDKGEVKQSSEEQESCPTCGRKLRHRT